MADCISFSLGVIPVLVNRASDEHPVIGSGSPGNQPPEPGPGGHRFDGHVGPLFMFAHPGISRISSSETGPATPAGLRLTILPRSREKCRSTISSVVNADSIPFKCDLALALALRPGAGNPG